jgi:hypothetical protein
MKAIVTNEDNLKKLNHPNYNTDLTSLSPERKKLNPTNFFLRQNKFCFQILSYHVVNS